jgi:hypothetical protein
MRLAVVILVGVLASFALTILGEQIVVGLMDEGIGIPFIEFPLIPLIVGILVGLFMKNNSGIAAALSLAPWAVWLIFASNGTHSTVWHWAITAIIVGLCLAIGIGAAVLVGARMANFAARRALKS